MFATAKKALTKEELADLNRRAVKQKRVRSGHLHSAKELLQAVLQGLSEQDMQRMNGKVLDLIEFHAFSEPGKGRDDSEEFAAYLVELILQHGER